jgi:hypothetical protein
MRSSRKSSGLLAQPAYKREGQTTGPLEAGSSSRVLSLRGIQSVSSLSALLKIGQRSRRRAATSGAPFAAADPSRSCATSHRCDRPRFSEPSGVSSSTPGALATSAPQSSCGSLASATADLRFSCGDFVGDCSQ